MAAGKAIISSDLPVLREVLNSNNAILVDPENVDEWNKAILMLFDDPDRRQNIAFQAQSDFYKLYTWKKRMKFIIETIFRENCDRKN